MSRFAVTVMVLTLILGGMACGRGEPAVTQIAVASTSVPTPTPIATPTSNAQQISKANQEYLKEIGVEAVLTPEEKTAAIGVSNDMARYTDCFMEQVGQSLNRPRGMVFASLPYVSEVYPAGSTSTVDLRLDYQLKYLNRDTLGPLIMPCIMDAYAHHGEVKQTQEYEMLEVAKAGAMVYQIGLLSPDMAYNCQEWTRTNRGNYFSLRAGSVKRRGESAGPRFDYAWGRAKETINSVCAS